jgi:hypothetical protein
MKRHEPKRIQMKQHDGLKSAQAKAQQIKAAFENQ